MRKCNRRLARHRKLRKSRLPEIMKLRLLGLSVREIAEKVGISKTTVHYWLQRLHPEEPSGGSQDVVEGKAAAGLVNKIAGRNPLRYDAIYQRAIRAWDRSQPEKKIEVVEQSAAVDAEGGASKKVKRLTRTETQTADSSLLTKALDALKAIDRLKQDSPPQKTGIAPTDGGTIPMSSLSVEDFHDLTDLQLDALEARLVEKYGKDAKEKGSPVERLEEEASGATR
jgi:hypothetical protein